MKLLNLLRVWRSERGSAAIELVMVAPVLMIMIIGLVDFGRNLYGAASLENAARTGIQYAQIYPGDGAGLVTTVRSAGGVAADADVAWEAYCVCPNGTRINCSLLCGADKPLWLISVAVSQPYQTIIPYPSLILPATINGSAVLRVR